MDALSLSFKPLFALRILLRECETFFLGTASSHGGKSSSKEPNEGMLQPNDLGASAAGTARDAVRENLRKRDEREVAGRKAMEAMVRDAGNLKAREIQSRVGASRVRLYVRPRPPHHTMFRFTRPLLQVTKLSTGITGIPVHKNPLPVLSKLYETTLAGLATLPEHSVYRQGTEAVVRHKLSILNSANGDVAAVEKGLDEGQIEESLLIAEDELNLVGKVAEWKSCVHSIRRRITEN